MSEVVYGVHAVERLIKQGAAVRTVQLVGGRLNPRLQKLQRLAERQGIPIERVPRARLDRLGGVHQGVAAVLDEQARTAPALTEADLPALVEARPDPLLIFLDEVQDPHNLGAILRTADATGAQAVVIPRHQSVGVTPVVRKVACGAAETVPVVMVNNLARTLAALKEHGLWIIGLAGETDRVLFQQDLRGPVGLVLGAEGRGLRRLVREQCDYLCALPMMGSVESLNVSVAAGVALYEVVRQRHYAD